MEHHITSPGALNRQALRARIDHLIRRLSAGELKAVRDTMYDRRWRANLDVGSVDSGQLAYADNLLDEAHSMLRQSPTNMGAAIEKLERARGKLE